MDFLENIDISKILFWAGQIFSVCSAASLIISSIRFKKEKIMFWQMMDATFISLTDLCLGGYSAAVINLIAVARNALAIKNSYTKYPMIACVFVSIVFGLLVNTRGWVGFIAIAAGITLNVGIYYAKTDQQLRQVLFVSLSLWLIHDIALGAVVVAIVEAVSIGGLVINFFRRRKSKTQIKAKKLPDLS